MGRTIRPVGRSIEVNGRTVGGGTAIPDSVVSQLEFEDEGDTSTAIDSIGIYDHSINGPAYTTNSAVGDHALDYDGSTDQTVGQSSLDLVGMGSNDSMSVMGFANPNSTSNTAGYIVSFGNPREDSALGIQDQGGSVRGVLDIGGNTIVTPTVPISATDYTHVYAQATQSNVVVVVGGPNGDSASESHSDDITTIGSQTPLTGGGPFKNYFVGQIDDVALANDVLSDSELQRMVDRAN